MMKDIEKLIQDIEELKNTDYSLFLELIKLLKVIKKEE